MLGEIGTMADIGDAVRRVRVSAGMSQDAFAAALGTTQRYLSELERGLPKVLDDRLVAMLARAGVRLLYESDD